MTNSEIENKAVFVVIKDTFAYLENLIFIVNNSTNSVVWWFSHGYDEIKMKNLLSARNLTESLNLLYGIFIYSLLKQEHKNKPRPDVIVR